MESPTRRRLSGTLFGALAALSLAGIARASVGGLEQAGVFALLGGTPQIASKFWADHASGLSATLKVRQFQLDGRPILDYDVDMEHEMHMVIVRDDFATFAHLHPAFDATTGTFWQPFTKEANHRYYVYADSTPHGLGQQVFRFTIESDGTVTTAPLALSPSPSSVVEGPYAVNLSETTFPANTSKKLKLTIEENGRPARDLGTYLGAAAHAVFINTSTLAYVHVHPMVHGKHADMQGMDEMAAQPGPHLRIMVPPLPAGTYKLWIQFLGANAQLYTAPFTILAR